ncbi:MAG: Aspartyl/glutamyl-tRNA(Asn/Gln) amidotransferase subunit B [Parcubacteria group bacterium GW2011_GWA1_47_10]|nr:MAG: Aspartyl/glutamyl-tRNA(Asn/Gln) amidotransferase subunit B [Parcubacteria group bacterium GW2011_GWA1_47_10]
MAESKYYVTIGLEIHAELKTQTKMFCACKNDPDENRPNTNVCPVCTAHPGALPVPNKKAIENVIKVGLAIGGSIADFTEFDRKNYFYPDIPKGYQISQYKFPIVTGGHLAGMDVTRVHLEEDTGTNKHIDSPQVRLVGNTHKSDLWEEGYSLIDFNRAGVPLMELVTEPHTFESAEEAAKKASHFAKEFQLILWYLDVSEANMEKGEMRVEVNISITRDPKVFGTKVEVKNLNSFRSVERAIKYEAERMTKLLDAGKGEEIVQETRGWDDSKQATFSQRKKESSHDYRYFPDPDLPKMMLHEAFDLEQMKKELPELPEEKRERYKNEFGIKDEDIESYINDLTLGKWFEEVVPLLKNKDWIQIASNYITSDYLGIKKSNSLAKLPSPKNFAELINLVAENSISSRVAKNILAIIVIHDESPEKIAAEKNLLQAYDEDSSVEFIKKIIEANPKIVADYKGGKANALMSLVGIIMKETDGTANPQVAKKLLEELLK